MFLISFNILVALFNLLVIIFFYIAENRENKLTIYNIILLINILYNINYLDYLQTRAMGINQVMDR